MTKTKKGLNVILYVLLSIFLVSVAVADITSDQVIYMWDMDSLPLTSEGNGTVTNLANIGGTIVGGLIGNAIDLGDTEDDWLWNNTFSTANITQVRTIEFWIKPETMANGEFFFHIGDCGGS